MSSLYGKNRQNEERTWLENHVYERLNLNPGLWILDLYTACPIEHYPGKKNQIQILNVI